MEICDTQRCKGKNDVEKLHHQLKKIRNKKEKMMKKILIRQIIAVGIITILWVLPFTIINAQKTEIDRTPPILPDFNLNTRGERGNPMLEKLAPELRTLYKQ